MKSTIKPVQPFSFKATVFSHGWIDLPPFRHNSQSSEIETSFSLQKQCRKIYLGSETDAEINIRCSGNLSCEEMDAILSEVKKMFRLNEDFETFYELAAIYKEYNWIVKQKAGRMLRCRTLWEDMVKMLCTTNCTWNLTRIMVQNLVDKMGGGCFPLPELIAGQTEQYLRQEIKMGYRSPYLLDLSRKITTGEINLDHLENWSGDTLSLYKEMRRLKGFGHYAVAGLLKLLGHYSYMGSDSWSRKKFSEIHGYNHPCSEDDIQKHYQQLGQWCGLFFWMDVTREWYEKNPFV